MSDINGMYYALIKIDRLIERYAGAELKRKEFLNNLQDQVKDLRRLISNVEH